MFADDSGITLNAATVGVVGVLLSSVVGALVVIFRLLMAAKDAQIAEIREQRDGFKKVADRVVTTLEAVSDKQQIDAGGVPIPKLTKPIPEHNSPTTERQLFSSDIESLKAREAAAKLKLAEHAATTPALPEPVKVVEISPEAAKAIKDATKDA